MMRQSETMRAASRLLLSHPIVCLLAVLAAVVVVLGVLGPIKVVYAADVASPVEGENFARPPTGTTLVSDTSFSGGQALKFTADVTASHTVNCSAVCDVVLMARAGQSGGTPSFSVNGSTPQAITTSNQVAPEPYTFDVNLPAGSNTPIEVTASGTGTGHNAFLDVATFPADGGGGGTPPAACADGSDNDADGKIDFPNDPGCSDSTDNDETDPLAATSPRLVGAGDIAASGNADVATGDLIDARPDATVFTAGDNAYPNGSASDFTNKYEPAWGPFKARTKPSPGNHEYETSNASAYKNYFGSLATPNGTTYYAYNLGDWRIYSLDSNIVAGTTSVQYQWLQNDLAANKRACMAAYWHHPIASSGRHGNIAIMREIFALLDSNGADLVLNGHDHNYERFANINSSGAVDANGMREIIVGTGGTGLRGQGFVQPGSEVRNFDTRGIVDINLSSTGYSGTFVPAPGFGSFTDSFNGTCGT